MSCLVSCIIARVSNGSAVNFTVRVQHTRTFARNASRARIINTHCHFSTHQHLRAQCFLSTNPLDTLFPTRLARGFLRSWLVLCHCSFMFVGVTMDTWAGFFTSNQNTSVQSTFSPLVFLAQVTWVQSGQAVGSVMYVNSST